jgi:peptidoglycan/LPS O-acetylase OafA/YrhL
MTESRSAGGGDRARIETLDVMRGLAALSVVFYHCLCVQPGFNGISFDAAHAPGAVPTVINLLALTPVRLVWAGREAVGIFFVLSGFVLALPFVENTYPGYPGFAIRRFCRIYLPYAAAILLSLVLYNTAAAGPVPEASAWFNGFWVHSVTPDVLRDQALMLGQDDRNFLDPVIWSLVHEMRVSLLFPLLVFAVWRLGVMAPLGAVAAGYIVLKIGAAPMGIDGTTVLGSLIETIGVTPLFLLGIGIARHLDWIKSRVGSLGPWRIRMLVALGLLLIWVDVGVQKPHFRDVTIGIGAALIVAAALANERAAPLLRARPLLWLGKISYSLYLVHLPLLLAVIYVFHGYASVGVLAALFPIGAFAAASFMFLFVERPAIRLGRKLAKALLPFAPATRAT